MTFPDNIDLSEIYLQEVFFPEEINGVHVYVKRIDLVHPLISGNKWFKLKYNLIKAHEEGVETILTFGGAYSNHIYATAAAGKEFGFSTIGIIRGEKHLPLNPTLTFATECGMKIFYVDRATYRNKHLPEFQQKLIEKFGKIYIVPEGGTNVLAVKGCSEIPSLIEIEYDCLCTACGTAGTISGLIAGLDENKNVLGFSALRGGAFLIKQTEKLLKDFSRKNYSNWSINLDYHFGGYAKINRELVLFIHQFEGINGIPLDPIYTGKMMYGIFDLARTGYFKPGTKIIALHTGGLQGVEGMKDKMRAVLF
jgi:1-aminocyclopropane-1-carboxylate deaminase/D-cysteine desulfhydrase-like pyridoxal-dependent ACC family enzyme